MPDFRANLQSSGVILYAPMTIAKRMIVLVCVPLAALLGLAVFTGIRLSRVEERSRFVAESRILALATLGNCSRSFEELRVDVRDYVLASDSEQRADARRRFDEHDRDVTALLQNYADHLLFSDEGRRHLSDFQSLGREWVSRAKEVMALVDNGRHDEAVTVLKGPLAEIGSRVTVVSREWIRNNEELATTAGREAVQAINDFRASMLIAIAGAAVLASLLGFITFRRIVKPIRALQSEIETIAAGDYAKDVPFTGQPDETGALARSIVILKKGAAEMDEQRWVKAQSAALIQELQNVNSLNEFGQRLLSGLVPLLGGGVACFYSFDEASRRAHRLSSYGVDASISPTDSFGLGESLVGQCAQERRMIVLSSLPPDYLRIGSGLGSASPLWATALPLIVQDSLLGIIEIASFRQFMPRENALLSEVLPIVALSLLRKEEEAELRDAKRKAEGATEMKSMFLANMSHEIRTPMNAIIGLTHLALRTPLNARQRDYLSKVHNAGTSLLGIINDILDFSKIEAGKLDIETTGFKLDDVLQSVTTITGQKAHDKGLEFLVRVQPGIPQALLGDPLRLGQVLTNLINNSIKFTERGEIHLAVELLQHTGQKCQLKFSVRDTGSGMTKEQSERLFQPFVQADMSITRKHGGTGLGLTICRRLVELMGGQIWLESEPGVGSTFSFTAWLAVSDQERSRKIIPEKLATLRALIVDDNAAAREILEDLLRGVVQQTDVVSSAVEAISAIKQHDGNEPYDVVFMDWRMPNMDGLQAARNIKSDETLKSQPAIVMVTAFARDDVREEAEQLHLDGFLVKPVTRSTIVDALVNVFVDSSDQKAAISQASEEGIRLTGMRLLLAEDNDINQQIVVELLEGVGAHVEIANNGREVVDRLMQGMIPPPYDVILMDLQMPILDGHQATTMIRADARFANLPIIAMTAHATSEERQRCLAAGMNDHIAKPIDPALLFETLRRFYKLQPADGLPVINGLDTQDGLARVAGNKQLYLKLLRQFAEQQASTIGALTEALARADRSTAERRAHTLKGVAGNIGARSIQAAAGSVEKLIREGSSPDMINTSIRELASILDPFLAEIAGRLSQPSAPPPLTANTDPGRTGAAAAELLRLLASFDAQAVDFVEANQTNLRPLFNAETWPAFMRLVQDFSFTEAQTELETSLRNTI